MPVVFRPVLARRGGFAQIVSQRGESHRQRVVLCRCIIHNHQDMQAGIDFRMVLCRLRHAEQGVNFGKHARERATFAQCQQHA